MWPHHFFRWSAIQPLPTEWPPWGERTFQRCTSATIRLHHTVVKRRIPNVAMPIKLVHSFPECVYSYVGQRTKRAAGRLSLAAMGWSSNERTSFYDWKRTLAAQVMLAHQNVRKRLFFYTDAFDTVCSVIVTQVPLTDLALPHSEQRHQVLVCLSGRLDWNQLWCATPGKEDLAVMAVTDRMHWIAVSTATFYLYMDHKDMVYILDPLSVVSNLTHTALQKKFYWTVRLSLYNRVRINVKIVDKVCVDLLGLLSAPRVMHRIVRIPELPSVTNNKFEWPTADIISETQQPCVEFRPPNLKERNVFWVNSARAIWVPNVCEDLQLWLFTIARTGLFGHRCRSTIEQALNKSYFCTSMTTDVRSFVRVCIHCLPTNGAKKVPRQFGPSMHWTKPNNLLQFDYIELGPSTHGEKYVVIVRDAHSSYAWFVAYPDTTTDNAAVRSAMGLPLLGAQNGLMSVGPTLFKNEASRLVAKGRKTPNHYMLLFCTWINGAMDCLQKELVWTFSTDLSELQFCRKEWPDLLRLVKSVLNKASSQLRGNIAPFTAFTWQEPNDPSRHS